MKFSIATALALAALACIALGVLSLASPQDRVGKASRLFFSLAALFIGLAAGVLVLW